MSIQEVRIEPISVEAFRPYGELLKTGTVEPKLINTDKCRRYSDLAAFDIADGKTGFSLFHADIRSLPYTLDLLERHPLGSQCFVPMQGCEYLAIVAQDAGGRPGHVKAFLVDGATSINIGRNVWHGVLTPLSGSGLFAVIDRIGEGANLEEFQLDEPILIVE